MRRDKVLGWFRAKAWAATWVFGLCVVVGSLSGCGSEGSEKDTSSKTSKKVANNAVKKVDSVSFGISHTGYNLLRGTFDRGQNITQVLMNLGVPSAKIEELKLKTVGKFDLRDLRTDRLYTAFINQQDSALHHFVYTIDATSYVRFDLKGDSINVALEKRPVTVSRRVVGGVVSHSLFQTLEKQGVNPLLAIEMAKIYDWSLDFFKVQEGDWFTVSYDEEHVDGKAIGIGAIHGVRFNFGKKDYYAIRHSIKGKPQYFSETGQAMRKRFLKAPLKFDRISSPFSRRRFHPVQRVFKPHLGTDYAAPTGTAIRSVGDGTVLDCGRRGGNGIWVKVNHGGGYETGYLHMSRLAKGMRRGMRVSQGQVIGYVGSTGLATGPHLCFRFWERGVQVNPKKIRTPQSIPMTKAQLPEFIPVRDKVVTELSSAIPTEAQGASKKNRRRPGFSNCEASCLLINKTCCSNYRHYLCRVCVASTFSNRQDWQGV